MNWFDTHAHLDGFAAAGNLAAVLNRAANAGVTQICAIGGSPAANDLAVRLAQEYPAQLHAAVGYDRDQAKLPSHNTTLTTLATHPAVVAIGEIGLDYYYSADTAPAQRDLFENMLSLALASRKPVIVHSRAADDDTIAMLTDFSTAWKKSFHSVENSPKTFPYHGKNQPDFPRHGKIIPEFSTPWKNNFHAMENGSPAPPPGVLHCFTGNASFAAELAALGFFISFSGIVTFKNAASLRAIARDVPANQLLIETDCPYLTPVPFRGKLNEPAHVVHVGEQVARVRGIPPAELAAQTFANARRLFQQEKR